MRLPFSGRSEKLETMNRILTEAAQKRTERIEELERRLAQLERESEAARKAIERAKVLEAVAAERAHLLNDKDKQLAEVREAATKYFSDSNGTHPGRNWPEMTFLWASGRAFRRGLTQRCPRVIELMLALMLCADQVPNRKHAFEDAR